MYGRCEKPSETISTYLAENVAHGVYSTSNPREGRLSHTAYAVVKEAKGLTLLDVELLTGRKHQIRVHLADRGHPVVGDTRYGAAKQAHKRLALHARCLTFRHPTSGESLTFETKAPGYFRELVGNFDHLLGRQAPALQMPERREPVRADLAAPDTGREHGEVSVGMGPAAFHRHRQRRAAPGVVRKARR